ncbi:tetratricopeptide repeat protein [Rhodopirellula islandica]|nr:tetratricopeptide repeat protein [Rhodopirellula islandica]
MGISGPDEWAEPIEEALLSDPPSRWQLIAADQLEGVATIRLVSGFEEEPSDMAVSSAARRQGLQYLLHGEILQATGHEEREDKVSLSWRLTGLQPGTKSAGMPITVDEALISQRYPQLMNVPDVAERTRRAAILETKRLLAASVVRQQVALASPRMLPGSRAIRRGNELARSGNWPMAEQVWNQVLESHPRNPAALINTSIAAAARQDFTTAKERISEAVRRSAFSPANKSLAEETLVWIELRQRDYHNAFDLPPPPEGWLVSRGE